LAGWQRGGGAALTFNRYSSGNLVPAMVDPLRTGAEAVAGGRVMVEYTFARGQGLEQTSFRLVN
jgi:hypothetical protein